MDADIDADIDVVIVSWNTREELLACLASLAASPLPRLHVVVVDNASSDGSADAVAAAFPDVELLRRPHNDGFAVAANAGVRAGRARAALFLNPDTVVPPGTLATLVDHLDALPHHAAVAPRLRGADGALQHSVHRFPSLGISLLLALGLQHLAPRALRARWLLEGSWHGDTDRDVDWAVFAAILVRRQVLDEVGPLDEGRHLYAEDLEWCLRATRAGHPVRFTPHAEVIHLGERSAVRALGDDRLGAKLASAAAVNRRTRGTPWALLFDVINGGATLGRYGFWWATYRARRSPRALRGLNTWRPYARYYLGRGRTS